MTATHLARSGDKTPCGTPETARTFADTFAADEVTCERCRTWIRAHGVEATS